MTSCTVSILFHFLVTAYARLNSAGFVKSTFKGNPSTFLQVRFCLQIRFLGVAIGALLQRMMVACVAELSSRLVGLMIESNQLHAGLFHIFDSHVREVLLSSNQSWNFDYFVRGQGLVFAVAALTFEGTYFCLRFVCNSSFL